MPGRADLGGQRARGDAVALHKQGRVIGRGTNRVNVRFDGEHKMVSVRPHLVRVLDLPGGAQ